MAEANDQPKINPLTKKPWTDHDRLLQSMRAKANGLGRRQPQTKPAAEVIANEAKRNAKKLADMLMDIALKGQTQKLRMDATKLMLDMEHRVSQERRDDEQHLLKLSRDELVSRFFNQLRELTGLDLEGEGEQDQDVVDAIDTTAVVVEEEGQDGAAAPAQLPSG